MQCANCSALLAPGSGFCLVCKQPVIGEEGVGLPTSVGRMVGPPTLFEAREAQAAEALRTAPPRAEIMRQNERETLHKAEMSRWKKGPTSFSLGVKIAMTIVILLFAPIGGFWGWTALFGIVYFPVAGLLLWGLWRKQRVT